MGLPASGLPTAVEPPEWRPSGAQRATANPPRDVLPLRNSEYSLGILYLRVWPWPPHSACQDGCSPTPWIMCLQQTCSLLDQRRQHVLNNWLGRCRRCVSPPETAGEAFIWRFFLSLAILSAWNLIWSVKHPKLLRTSLYASSLVTCTRRNEAFHNFTCQEAKAPSETDVTTAHPNKAPLLPGSPNSSVCSPFAILAKYFKCPIRQTFAGPISLSVSYESSRGRRTNVPFSFHCHFAIAVTPLLTV